MNRIWLTKSLCNDGSPAAYYFAPYETGSNMNNIFIIYLEGGDQCHDAESCASRYSSTPDLMSSKSFESMKSESYGLLSTSPDYNILYGANKVYIPYCTSDAYMGNLGSTTTWGGWFFQGQSVVYEVINRTIAIHNLNSNSIVIFSGKSAGGRGAMVLLDHVRTNYLPRGVRVLGFLDSPYHLDLKLLTSSYWPGFAYEMKQIYSTLNIAGSGILSDECQLKYSGSDSWKCLMGTYRLEFVQTSYFIMLSRYDSFQLSKYIGVGPPFPEQKDDWFAGNFSALTLSDIVRQKQLSISRITSLQPANASYYGYYLWTCYNHAISQSENFSSLTNDGGVSPKAAFDDYVRIALYNHSFGNGKYVTHAGGGAVLSYIDTCSGLACGSGCVAHYKPIHHVIQSNAVSYEGSTLVASFEAFPVKSTSWTAGFDVNAIKGTVAVVLVLIGLVLAILPWYRRMKRSNNITAASGIYYRIME